MLVNLICLKSGSLRLNESTTLFDSYFLAIDFQFDFGVVSRSGAKVIESGWPDRFP